VFSYEFPEWRSVSRQFWRLVAEGTSTEQACELQGVTFVDRCGQWGLDGNSQAHHPAEDRTASRAALA